MESSDQAPNNYPPPLRVLPAWVYDPRSQMRSRGFATSDLYIYPGAVAAEPRNVAGWISSVPRVVYQWRVAVAQRIVWSYRLNFPGMTSLLVDIDGKLGSVVVRPGKELAPALERAGFEVISDTVRGWETPQPIRTRDYPEMVGRLPDSILVDHSWWPEKPAFVRR